MTWAISVILGIFVFLFILTAERLFMLLEDLIAAKREIKRELGDITVELQNLRHGIRAIESELWTTNDIKKRERRETETR